MTVLALAGMLAACASKPVGGYKAPVEDRSVGVSSPAGASGKPAAVQAPAQVGATVAPASKQPPGFENAGKPG